MSALRYYDYRRVRIAPRHWLTVREAIGNHGQPAVVDAGGAFFGLWLPQIGLASTEGLVMTAWDDPETARARGDLVIDQLDHILESHSEIFEATSRPDEPAPPPDGGVYAHRQFDIELADWPEFQALSEAAWPTFEPAFDARIIGFWRSVTARAPDARVLLITRYPDLASWERSRGEFVNGEGEDASRLFRKRREMTKTTRMVTTLLA